MESMLQSSQHAMRVSLRDHLATGCMVDYASGSMVYADLLEESGLDAAAARRRLKAITVRAPGVRWPRPGLLPGLSAHQVAELRKATCRAFGLLVGTPGTGKTYATGAVVAELCRTVGTEQIAVCAPTGKAAVRISEAMATHGAAIQATTIHSLLEIGRNGHDGKGWGFLRNRHNPLSQKIIIVDEASMLDTSLLASLLDACEPGTHMLLVGDPNQLPPVGHGAPLRDLIAAGVPCGTLSEVRRNAGRIVEACAQIRQGLPFEVGPPGNLEVEHRTTPEGQAGCLESVIDRARSMIPGPGGRDLDPVEDVQIITAVNKTGTLSRDALNKQLQGLLNPNGERCAGNPFRVGDKAICLRNGAYQFDVGNGFGLLPPEAAGAVPRMWIANGEMGRVARVTPGQVSIVFDKPPRPVIVPVGQSSGGNQDEDGGSNDFELGYAITCHKSQGSQWPVVIVVLDASPGAARVAGREWLYTAISRAETHCILVGRLAVAHHMAKRPALESRLTFLRELLTSGK